MVSPFFTSHLICVVFFAFSWILLYSVDLDEKHCQGWTGRKRKRQMFNNLFLPIWGLHEGIVFVKFFIKVFFVICILARLCFASSEMKLNWEKFRSMTSKKIGPTIYFAEEYCVYENLSLSLSLSFVSFSLSSLCLLFFIQYLSFFS